LMKPVTFLAIGRLVISYQLSVISQQCVSPAGTASIDPNPVLGKDFGSPCPD